MPRDYVLALVLGALITAAVVVPSLVHGMPWIWAVVVAAAMMGSVVAVCAFIRRTDQ